MLINWLGLKGLLGNVHTCQQTTCDTLMAFSMHPFYHIFLHVLIQMLPGFASRNSKTHTHTHTHAEYYILNI